MFENLALRHQILVLKRNAKKPKLKSLDRLLWVTLQRLWSGWQRTLVIIQPRTVIAWHRAELGRESWLAFVLIGIDESLKQCILRLKVLLDLKCLVQNGLGILVGVLGSGVGGFALNFLAHHDDGQ